jgi:heat-inducible transcriptional repressor
MADLEEMGLLHAPHTSAGRLPTETGLRVFVDGLLQVGNLTDAEREAIEAEFSNPDSGFDDALNQATKMLSGLARCAGLVVAPKTDRALKHIEFVNLGDGRALVVLVTADGLVENRVIEMPMGTPPSALMQAANYLNAKTVGLTLGEALAFIEREIQEKKGELDEITARLVEAGLAFKSGEGSGSLIVKGQAHLLSDIAAIEDLERVRRLFETLENKDLLMRLLDLTKNADGVQIFFGAENELFDMAGCSMIVAPFMGSRNNILGAIGVIGPTRINYARIIPIVDYTSKIIGRLAD